MLFLPISEYLDRQYRKGGKVITGGIGGIYLISAGYLFFGGIVEVALKIDIFGDNLIRKVIT